jgi:peptidoglycan DL-endopeptidase CwlO
VFKPEMKRAKISEGTIRVVAGAPKIISMRILHFMVKRDIFRQTKVKQKLLKMKNKSIFGQKIVIAALVAVFAFGFIGSPFALADEFDARINQLREQNEKKEERQSVLLNEAASFEDKIKGLKAQIGILETQIKKDQTKSDELKRRITEAEKELERQKDLLGQNIRAMYLEGDISTLEMLASSKDLSEFVDKEQYRNSVKDKIKKSLDEINALKLELSTKRDLLEKTIADKQKRQGKLDSQRAEVARLLGMNTAQRNALESQISKNNDKISKLRAEQAAANALLFGGGLRNIPDTSGYPWANYPFPNEVADPWGMYLRQCVSYTAWKVWKSGRHMPYWGGRGNANQWDDNARAEGIPVSGTPRRGDVGVSNAGYYGHVVYVEHVYGDGRILVSQYNASWTGTYSEAVVSASKFVYIHF